MKDLIRNRFLCWVFFANIFCSSLNAEAKDSTFLKRSNHSTYLEIGGNAVIYSFNYEYKLKELKNSYLVQSIGFQVPDLDDKFPYYISGEPVYKRRLENFFVPLRIAWISHKTSKHHLEGGIGATYYTTSFLAPSSTGFDFARIQLSPWSGNIYYSPNLGYRYTGDKGMLLRVSLSPIVHRFTNPNFQFYGGVSIGYNFNKKKI